MASQASCGLSAMHRLPPALAAHKFSPPYLMGRPRLLFHQQRWPHFGVCGAFRCAALVPQVGQSGWTRPLPLENGSVGSEVEDFNTQPVLIRAKIPEWGTVHEVVARTELVGRGFERTLVSSRGDWRLDYFSALALATVQLPYVQHWDGCRGAL